MKINKRNLRHWWYLACSALYVLLAAVLRKVAINRGRGRVVMLYGHKFNGNLKAIYEHIQRHEDSIEVYYLSMDSAYVRSLRRTGVRALSLSEPEVIVPLSVTSLIVSDHGLHVLEWLLSLTNMRFADVWHGIPFKGFDGNDFQVQRRFDEVWVASPLLKQLYVKRFNFSEDSVFVTGYARTDVLVNAPPSAQQVRACLGMPNPERPSILFAPTWQQDDNGRSIFPFGLSPEAFLSGLDVLCEQHGITCVFRAHLNSGEVMATGGYRHIFFMSHEAYPDSEQALLAADMLVCDWSSIAFDYLLLNRPTVFLDVVPPFRKGFSLDAGYRFGRIVGDYGSMMAALAQYLGDPSAYQHENGVRIAAIRREVYGNYDDGLSSARCVERIRVLCG